MGLDRRLGGAAAALLIAGCASAPIRERCGLMAGCAPPPKMAPELATLDRLLFQRAIEMAAAVRSLPSFMGDYYRREFLEHLPPGLCDRMEEARALAGAGKNREAGASYQGLSVAAEVMALEVAFMQVADDKLWNLSLAVVATYELAGAAAEMAAGVGPPAMAAVNGGVVTVDRMVLVDGADALRKLLASGALDPAVVAGLAHMAVTQGPLTSEQARNLFRFEQKLPAGAGPTEIHDLPDGGKAFRAEVHGRVPGSKAIYEKQVDAQGRTLQYTKTTVDPSGSIVHVKDKITETVVEP